MYQRCLPFNVDLTYPSYSEIESVLDDHDKELIKKLNQVRRLCDKEFEVFNFYNGLNQIMISLRSINNMVQEYKPWNLMKQNKSDMRIKKLLFFIYESLRIAGILLQPIIPSLSDDLLNRLNVKKEERFYESALIDTKRIENKKLQSNSNILFKRL